jgi:hypothetical protein
LTAIDAVGVIAVSLPTIRFAAALVGAGVVLRCLKSIDASTSAFDEAFEKLCEMTGKPVVFQADGGLERTGIITGPNEWQGRRCVSIVYYEKPGVARHSANIYPEELSRVRLLNQSSVDLTGNRDGPRLIGGTKWLRACLGDGFFMAVSRPLLAVTIMDQKKRLHDELALKWITPDSQDDTGCLLDLLRPDNLPNYASSKHCRIIPSSLGVIGPDEIGDSVLVLAGSRPIARNVNVNGFRSVVAIIDRSDPQAELADNAVNAAFYNRSGEWNPIPEPVSDPAISVLSFKR